MRFTSNVQFSRIPNLPGTNKDSLSVKDAASALNIPLAPDINAPNVSSMSLVDFDIAIDRNMQRASSFASYLPYHVARTRQNLKICTNTIVTRVVFAQENGKFKANGVEMRNTDGQSKLYFAKATSEVVLCCGALASPQLLMLRFASSSDGLLTYRAPMLMTRFIAESVHKTIYSSTESTSSLIAPA